MIPIIIAAMDMGSVIGNKGRLPWHLPEDLARFKRLTTGHNVLMGRHTYESIGHPLPNRTNFVLSTNEYFRPPGCITVSNLDEVYESCDGEEVYVIGGAEVYDQMLPYAERLELTLIYSRFEGDTKFPMLPANTFEFTHIGDLQFSERANLVYQFVTITRI